MLSCSVNVALSATPGMLVATVPAKGPGHAAGGDLELAAAALEADEGGVADAE